MPKNPFKFCTPVTRIHLFLRYTSGTLTIQHLVLVIRDCSGFRIWSKQLNTLTL